MSNIRKLLIILAIFISPLASADVHVNIGINVPTYPQLVVVPGYPVYYAPRLQANFFFYDGMYWVYQDDYWYASEWYNGPWWLVEPDFVPVFILRVPVRYYHRPPPYFIGWRQDAPPRWGNHWGYDWEQRRRGWDRWDRSSAPPPAPPPIYQRQYSGDRYPQQVEQQHDLRQQNYRYQPRDSVVQKHYQERSITAPIQQEKPRLPEDKNPRQPNIQRTPEDRDSRQQDTQRYETRQQRSSPAIQSQPPQEGGPNVKRSNPSAPQQGRSEAQNPRQQPESGDMHSDQKPRKHGQQDNDSKGERGRDRN